LTPNLGTVSKEVSILLNKGDIEPILKRMVKHKLLNRSKRRPIDGWRLNDEEFDELKKTYWFTLEGCCDPLGFNGHMQLPFHSENDSLLDHDVSKQLIYCNPQWSLAIKCLESIRACKTKSPLDTEIIIALSDWPKFKAVTKKFKLI